jgi:pimeloyl-ACP methyl ester carboxylesterase
VSAVEAPAWFREALAAPVERGVVRVAGVPIVWRAWGGPRAGEPGQDLVLVHGGAAHGGWWDHIGPRLASDRRVVALDLSGHGDSGAREDYSADAWADEIEAVAEDAGVGSHPMIVGHSLGGLVSLRVARRASLAPAGVIVVDSPMSSSFAHARATERIKTGPHKTYATPDEVLARFRPVPNQHMLPYVRDHIAAASIREVEGRWTWKFDHGVFPTTANVPDRIDDLDCPVVLLAAEHGLLADEYRRSRVLPEDGAAIVLLPDAGHAPMLDRPLALLAAIEGVISGWATTRILAAARA